MKFYFNKWVAVLGITVFTKKSEYFFLEQMKLLGLCASPK